MENRSNQTVNNTKDYYHIPVTTPFVEHLIAEMEERFGDAPTTVVKGFSIIPSIFVNQANWKPDFIEFANCYANDLPSLNSILPELLLDILAKWIPWKFTIFNIQDAQNNPQNEKIIS